MYILKLVWKSVLSSSLLPVDWCVRSSTFDYNIKCNSNWCYFIGDYKLLHTNHVHRVVKTYLCVWKGVGYNANPILNRRSYELLPSVVPYNRIREVKVYIEKTVALFLLEYAVYKMVANLLIKYLIYL